MSNVGIEQSVSVSLTNPAPRSILSGNNLPRVSSLSKASDRIPVLSAFEVKCLLLQISYMETGSNVAAIDGDRLGQYATSEYLLKKYGYKDDLGWTGLDGVDEQSIFLDTPSVQDKILETYIVENYTKLIQADAIRANDTKAVVAGMLAVAYQFQDAENPSLIQTGTISNEVLSLIQNEANSNYNVVKAKIWRDNGNQQDSKNRPAGLFFNAGKYAIQNLAANYTNT